VEISATASSDDAAVEVRNQIANYNLGDEVMTIMMFEGLTMETLGIGDGTSCTISYDMNVTGKTQNIVVSADSNATMEGGYAGCFEADDSSSGLFCAIGGFFGGLFFCF